MTGRIRDGSEDEVIRVSKRVFLREIRALRRLVRELRALGSKSEEGLSG